ncbi:MAG: hypothetical protein U0931_35820 [Vulcanimicrobiota bacterium]
MNSSNLLQFPKPASVVPAQTQPRCRVREASAGLLWLRGRMPLQPRLNQTVWDGDAGLQLVPRTVSLRCLTLEERLRFVAQRDLLPPELLAFLTAASLEAYERMGVRLYLTPDGQGGYGLRGDELVSLFSLRKGGLGSELAREAIARGARRLECFDANGKLTRFYHQLGFREIRREPWNDDFAPPDWNYQRFGRPDLIEMELQSR